MNGKYIILSLCLILAGFAAGWEIALHIERLDESFRAAHVIPIVRYEYFDVSRNALIIAVFNPGTQSLEIDKAELVAQARGKHSGFAFKTPSDGSAPLVMDPGDTILVPFKKTDSIDSQTDKKSLWGKLVFRIRGSEDIYSLRHHFNMVSIDNRGQLQ